jgi:protein-S-isoprenylcysteine O-methyltransferase Ste14
MTPVTDEVTTSSASPGGPVSALVVYRPPRIALTLLAIAAAWHWLLPLPDVALHASGPIGAGLVLAGLAILLGGWWQFRQRDVAICPTAETRALLTDGIYAWTRNPMYLGMVTMLIGVAVGVGALSFWIAAVAYLTLLDRVFCRYEERKLAATFGSRYVDYREHVRRWL